MSYSIDSWFADTSGMPSYRLNDPNGTRTTEDAKNNIRLCTIKENKAKAVIEADFLSRGRNVKIEDAGIDNSGEFIESDKAVRADPDWKIVEAGTESLAEACVHSERFKTVSFKASKLKKAIKYSSSILVIRESYYLVFDSAACSKLLEYYDVKSVPRIYGGKPSVILDTYDVDALVKSEIVKKFEYTSAAQAVMKPLLKELY